MNPESLNQSDRNSGLNAGDTQFGHHMTDDQMDDLLIGDAAPALRAHLAACPACDARLTEFRATLGLFNQASLTWSEARSNTLSRDLSNHRPSFRLPAWSGSWSFALALLFLVALALSVALPRRQDIGGTFALKHAVGASGSPQADRDQEIASDNAMLQAIHSEIYRPEPSPLAPYEQAEDATPTPRHSQPRHVSPPQVRN